MPKNEGAVLLQHAVGDADDLQNAEAAEGDERDAFVGLFAPNGDGLRKRRAARCRTGPGPKMTADDVLSWGSPKSYAPVARKRTSPRALALAAFLFTVAFGAPRFSSRVQQTPSTRRRPHRRRRETPVHSLLKAWRSRRFLRTKLQRGGANLGVGDGRIES